MQSPSIAHAPADTGHCTAMHLHIRGQVQGVGYRMAMQTRARGLQLQGWVRNRRNGQVEAWVQGPRDRVETLVAWCQHGPATAQVQDVLAQPAAPDPQYTTFSCQETVA